jgi:CheY-like chemotaxis protein
VLLDVMMAVLDGRAVLRRIREDPRFRDLPVIVMSAGRDIQDELLGRAVFLDKPFELSRLLATVRRLLGE